MILQIPYREASGEIFFIYSNGSLNSSAVGLYVGASNSPWGRIRLLFSLLAVGCPLLSTLVRSRGSDRIALSGCNGAPAGNAGLPIAPGFPFIDAGLLFAPLAAGDARIVELDAAVDIGT